MFTPVFSTVGFRWGFHYCDGKNSTACSGGFATKTVKTLMDPMIS